MSDREIRELMRGPFVKFKTGETVKTGYIVMEEESTLVVWTKGKPQRIKRDQILFREE